MHLFSQALNELLAMLVTPFATTSAAITITSPTSECTIPRLDQSKRSGLPELVMYPMPFTAKNTAQSGPATAQRISTSVLKNEIVLLTPGVSANTVLVNSIGSSIAMKEAISFFDLLTLITFDLH
jgi:hypothetical protein